MAINEEVLNHYKWLIKNAPRLSSKDACEIMEWCYKNNLTALMLWKIPNKEYKKWYENNKAQLKTTLEEETTYVVSSNNKAFNVHAGGYSIFASSIGGLKRNEEYYQIDRIEDYQCEFAILIYITRC